MELLSGMHFVDYNRTVVKNTHHLSLWTSGILKFRRKWYGSAAGTVLF